MDEREMLIRVEQQLQDSIKNQSLILSDLKELFSKIEIESKAISLVKSDLSSHLETTLVRREETNRRFKEFEDKNKSFSESIIDINKGISDIVTFQKQIQTTLSLMKWIIGILFVAISTFWPIFNFLVK